MAKKIRIFDHFMGGLAISNKEGSPGSFQNSRSIDIDSEPTSFKILPKTAKISSTTVVNLIKWFTPIADGTVYGYDLAGNIYQNAAGVVTNIRTAPDSHGDGLGYFAADDYLYYTTDTVIGRYGPLADTPAFNDNYFSDGTFDKDSSSFGTGGAATYTVPTGAISELAVNRRLFTPTRDPQKSIEVNISARGTGDWTCTVHDSKNVVQASLTIANASLSVSGLQLFTFVTTWRRPILGQQYHFHLTSTVADGSIVTTTASSMADCDFNNYFQILVYDFNYHPIVDFFETIVFGNGSYLGTWDGFTAPIESNRVKLPANYTCRALTKLGEYVVAGCWKGETMTDNETGLLVFWDGVATDFNYSVEVPEGGINSMFASQNRLFFVAGNQGKLYAYTDGIQIADQLPRMTNQTYIEVSPGAMGMWQGNLLIGAPLNTDSTTFENSVYTYGQPTKDYSESLTQDYPVSTGTLTTASNNLKTGAVLGQGQTLHIGWRDGSTYGWDTVTNSSQPFTSASWESLILDDGKPYHQKVGDVIRVDHSALISGQSLAIAYKIDRAANWTTAVTNSTAATTDTRFNINKRFKEIEFRVSLVTSSTNQLEVYAITFSYEDRADEEVV